MTERDELMRPVSQQDHYLHDLCVSVRELVDLLKPKPLPALAPELAESARAVAAQVEAPRRADCRRAAFAARATVRRGSCSRAAAGEGEGTGVVMAFTYMPATAPGQVRLLIYDTNPAAHVYEDEDINTFLELEGNRVRLAAALALETMASNEAFTQKVIKLLDLSTDGAKTSDALLKRAAELRKQDAAAVVAEDALAGEAGFEVAEWPLGSSSLRTYLARGHWYWG